MTQSGYTSCMNEPTASERSEDLAGDDDREHSQDPAEGVDPDDEGNEDVPRVHPEDPAEG
jgi:hypothetical protein